MLFPRLVAFVFLVGFASSATRLPPDEVDSLQKIANTLGKTDWDFTVDPCSSLAGWIVPPNGTYENNVTCSCSSTVCHVVSIILKGQSLPGRVPPEMARLPFLQQIDLTRNYLNGTIPLEWGSLPLVNISLLGNRITGRIPKELANISTLANLTLEFNQLTGTVPPELGNLPVLERLLVSSNYLTGELPETLAKLTTMKDFRISDNNFTGSIPDFIRNWKNLTKLVIQGSGLSGPIPSSIATLTQITDLRISDLDGNGSTFPFLGNMTNLKTLILRSCNIVGPLPAYLGTMTKLKVLDLSFNNLTGPIPDSFEGILNTDFIYLTGNSLSGPVPSWMQKDGDVIDLSYNNFTSDNSSINCQPRTLNLFASSKLSTPIFVGKLVLKDFNIEDEAGGVNKPLRKNFTAVVTDSTLDIRFFWAGKGTIGIPDRGVYGPLISAISVDPDFPIPSENKGLSGGAIAGIVLGVLSVVSLVLFILWWKICRRRDEMLFLLLESNACKSRTKIQK